MFVFICCRNINKCNKLVEIFNVSLSVCLVGVGCGGGVTEVWRRVGFVCCMVSALRRVVISAPVYFTVTFFWLFFC